MSFSFERTVPTIEDRKSLSVSKSGASKKRSKSRSKKARSRKVKKVARKAPKAAKSRGFFSTLKRLAGL